MVIQVTNARVSSRRNGRVQMGDKSIQKKQYIIDVAAKVFAEMGYKNVINIGGVNRYKGKLVR